MTENRISEMACINVRNGAAVCIPVMPLASDEVMAASTFHQTTRDELRDNNAVNVEVAITYLDKWLSDQAGESIAILIGHNAFMADCIVLRAEMARCGVHMYTPMVFMDSLVYARQVLRNKLDSYSLTDICAYFDIECDVEKRHGALYDSGLLVRCLGRMVEIRALNGPTLIPGADSCITIRGVGSYVTKCLMTNNIATTRALAHEILGAHGTLDLDACGKFLTALDGCGWMTEKHVNEVAESCVEVLVGL